MKTTLPNPISPRPPLPSPTITGSPQNLTKNPNNLTDPSASQQPGPHKHRHKHITKSWTNPSFIGANIAIIGYSFWFLYQAVIYSKPHFWIFALVLYAVLFGLTYWAYWMTVCSDPGRVPFYYGYTPQLDFQMPRKYCLMCHNFKPERTHHCSSCQRCILNMDHHCPWVNNCIGFQNRKYFILFLIYISIGLLFSSIVSIIVLVQAISKAASTNQTDGHLASKILLTLVSLPLTFALISFTFFHLKIVMNNTTTLEGIIKRKSIEGEDPVDDYDAGFQQNCMQVFGQNFVCWSCPLPITGPKGNGLDWPKPNSSHPDHTNDHQTAPFTTQQGQRYQNKKQIYLPRY